LEYVFVEMSRLLATVSVVSVLWANHEAQRILRF